MKTIDMFELLEKSPLWFNEVRLKTDLVDMGDRIVGVRAGDKGRVELIVRHGATQAISMVGIPSYEQIGISDFVASRAMMERWSLNCADKTVTLGAGKMQAHVTHLVGLEPTIFFFGVTLESPEEYGEFQFMMERARATLQFFIDQC